jgi:hypothetical protein
MAIPASHNRPEEFNVALLSSPEKKNYQSKNISLELIFKFL